eukprot:TRINITY_DN2476_c0_g1_i1.p1 TRINITY_DN2476_c0_g1~~TRINITY_DN2476_c0_g1_i1.p1  ORF type:complete len:223 (-),score=11.74 TRINITY_DN2476_c0_g1_i1:324-992(-)
MSWECVEPSATLIVVTVAYSILLILVLVQLLRILFIGDLNNNTFKRYIHILAPIPIALRVVDLVYIQVDFGAEKFLCTEYFGNNDTLATVVLNSLPANAFLSLFLLITSFWAVAIYLFMVNAKFDRILFYVRIIFLITNTIMFGPYIVFVSLYNTAPPLMLHAIVGYESCLETVSMMFFFFFVLFCFFGLYPRIHSTNINTTKKRKRVFKKVCVNISRPNLN